MSQIRKSLGSFVILVVLVILVAENLPASYVKDQLAPVLPVTNAVGLRQEWGVFSPNPAQVEVNTFARIRFVDGSESIWLPPGGNGWLETNSAARWQKWSDRIRLDINSVDWPVNARLIARDVADSQGQPALVELVREWSNTPLPGEGFVRDDRQEFTFYRFDVAADAGELVDVDDPVNAGLELSEETE